MSVAGNERGRMTSPSLDRSEALWTRAQRVIPGGVYGHQNAGAHGERHPKFLARGEGSRVWDVDGNEYVDWMCAYGPMVLGYRNPVVDRAVAEQMELGDTLSLPGEAMVEYAEALVAKTAGMDWAIFGKNGADVTSWAIDTARGADRQEQGGEGAERVSRRASLDDPGAAGGATPSSRRAHRGGLERRRGAAIPCSRRRVMRSRA